MPRSVKLEESFDPNAEDLWQEKDGLRTITREYQLVTPLFGGGVEPRHPDPITTVRPSEIKGHLRFWWRAIRGWQSQGDLAQLLKREERIWGGVSEHKAASSVKLAVELLDPGNDEAPFEWVKRKDGKKAVKNKPHVAHGYLAFPLQPTKEDPTIYSVRTGVRFRLTLTYRDEDAEEVQAALWAWETFGGVGARTRRGFGSVVPKEFNPLNMETIRDKLKHWVRGHTWPEGVPYLTADSLFELFSGSWRDLAERYKAFRQWRNGQRGRSKWPEPDEIRRLTGMHSPGHDPKHPVRKFPRGHFGLPIVFHFKDKSDPPDTILKGETHERLASPLAFKPYAKTGPVLVYLLEGNRQLPEAYVLEAPHAHYKAAIELTPEEAQKIEPLQHVGGETDPVRAFVKWLKEERR